MTDEVRDRPDLDAIDARAAAAERGPWKVLRGERSMPRFSIQHTDNHNVVGLDRHEATATFVAHAQTDVPVLTAYARRLEAAFAEMAHSRDKWRKHALDLQRQSEELCARAGFTFAVGAAEALAAAEPTASANGTSASTLAEEALAHLTRYFSEPVMPVSRYCAAFRTWFKVAEAYLLKQYGDSSEITGYFISKLPIAIEKSNLLARLIYSGEKLRTRECPVHKGRWSGSVTEPLDCGCQSGSNITGWLLEE